METSDKDELQAERVVDWTSRKFSQCNEGRLANLTQPRYARRRAC